MSSINNFQRLLFFIFSFAFFLLLSSCGIYKNYTRSEIATEGLYGETYEAKDTTNFGNLAWKDVFTDPQLQELIQKGLDNNADLKIARLKISEAQASLRSAKLSYLPSFALSPQGTISSFDGAKATKSYELPLSASWEIEIFGKLTNAKKQEIAALEKSEAYRQAVQNQLIANIANAYFTLLVLDCQLEISEVTLQSWEDNIKATQALKTAGQTTQAAVAQAEANKLSVEASIFDMKLQIWGIENTICSLLGEMPKEVARGRLEEQSFPEEFSAGIPVQMLSNRPDVRQAEASLKQAFYYTNESRSYFYPSLTLSGSIGWTNSGGGIVSNPGALLWQAVGSLTQPVFNQGKNKARLKIAQAQQEEAQLTFQQTILDAGIEVNYLLTAYQTTRAKAYIYEKQTEQLETAVSSTKLLMQHGTTNYLEVLTAQQTLLQAELDQVSNYLEEIQCIINLYSALGGGR
ncbi:MAG: TolC family protein [Bacteroidales bacterium]|jgi:NodT family efflux transporter outer membrane factor (OMF) lipoprotein|nr:TolC family protein [Bacteroidales bacterium]